MPSKLSPTRSVRTCCVAGGKRRPPWPFVPRKAVSVSMVVLLAGALTLAACGTVPSAGPATPLPSAVVENTPGPVAATDTAPPVPSDTPKRPAALAPAVLKYRLLDEFPDFFFCDPDAYPVARGDEAELARERFPALQADAAEFQAILEHCGWAGRTSFGGEEQLAIYREHKRLAALELEPAGAGYRFQFQVADAEGAGFLVTGTIDGGGAITVVGREPTAVSCPRCLAVGTWIDTPRGPAAVEELRDGDAVWTADAAGVRRMAVVVATARVPAPAGHRLVHVLLDDGRELYASPGHPTAAGRPLGDLRVGDRLDGGRVVQVARLPYGQAATYDLLPSGGTGRYWANGILVGSTLQGRTAGAILGNCRSGTLPCGRSRAAGR